MKNVNKRLSPCLALITLAVLLIVPPKISHAATPTSPGPYIYYDLTQPAAITSLDENGNKLPSSNEKVAVKQFGVSLLAPIPAQFFGGILVLKTDYANESRVYSGSTDSLSERGLPGADSELLVPGIIYLPHAAEGGPRWFLLASRYGSIKFKDVPHFMGEYLVGFDLMDRLPLRFGAGDITKTRILVRLRRFPHADRYLFLAEHSVFTAEGWFLSLGIPSHLIGGWEDAPGDLNVEGGIKFSSKEFPHDFAPAGSSDSMFGWSEGYTTTLFASMRRRVHGAIFGSIESGLWSETSSTYLENGKRIGQYSTRFVPYGRIAVETHFVTP